MEHTTRILPLTKHSGLWIWQLANYLWRCTRCRKCAALQWSHTCRFWSTTGIFLRSGSISSGNQTERCWTRYSSEYSSHSSLKELPLLSLGITTFSVQMASSGIPNLLCHQDLQIALNIATNVFSSGMSVSGTSVPRIHFEILSLLTINTPQRDHSLYIMLSDADNQAANAKLSLCHGHG